MPKRILEKKLKKINEHIAEYLSQMDINDKDEPDSPSPEQIKAAIEELTLRKEKYKDYLKELIESGDGIMVHTICYARVKKRSQLSWGLVSFV